MLKNVTVRTSSDRGIRVEAGGAPQITDSTVTGTTGGVGTGIEIGAGASAKLQRVTIRQCATHGLLVGTVGGAELTDVEISGNGGGAITVEPGAELTGLTGMTLTGNGQNGVRHRGGELAASETWKSFGYPYYVVDRRGLRARGGRAGADDRARGRGEGGQRQRDLGRETERAGSLRCDRDGGEADRLHDAGRGGAGVVARSAIWWRARAGAGWSTWSWRAEAGAARPGSR